MRFTNWKPDVRTEINYGHPLAIGISACFLFNEGGGPFVDLVTRNVITTQGSAVRGKFNFGVGLDCRGSESGARATAWLRLKTVAPKALVWAGQIHSSPSDFAGIFGLTYDNGLISPFTAYKLSIRSSGAYYVDWSNGGFSQSLQTSNVVSFTGLERQIIANIGKDPGGNQSTIEIWENRARLAAQVGLVSTDLVYGTAPQICIGTDPFSLSRDSKSVCRHCYIYDRYFSSDAIRWLYEEPYAFLRPIKLVKYFTRSISGLLSVNTSDNANFLADGLALVGGDPDFKIQLGDSLQQNDSTRIVSGLLQTFSDTVNNWADSVARLVGIPIQAFDSNQFNWADAVSLQFLAPLTVSKGDTLVLSDSVSVSLLNFVLSVTASDTMNLMADAVRLFNRLHLEFGDNFVLSDALRMRFTHLLRVAETLNLMADSPRFNFPAYPAFADDMNNLSDSVSVALSALVTRSAADTLAMSDSVSVELVTPYNPAADVLRIRRYLNDTE